MPAGRLTFRLLSIAVLAAAGGLAAAQGTAPATGPNSATALTPPVAPPATPPAAAAVHPAPAGALQPTPATLPARAAGVPVSPPAATAQPHAAPVATSQPTLAGEKPLPPPASGHGGGAQLDFMSMLFVFMLATFIGVGVIRRVSRLLHTPLMSLTNAISAIAVVGSIMVAGGMREYPTWIRTLGAIALFCSMTNIISGFLITDRMLKMFKTREGGRP